MRVVSLFGENQVQLGEDDPHEFNQFGREAHGILHFSCGAALSPFTSSGNKQHVEETGEVLIIAYLCKQRLIAHRVCSSETIHFRRRRTPDVPEIAEVTGPSLELRTTQSVRSGRLKNGECNVVAESPIALELRLREPLVKRGVVRKGGMLSFIVQDIARLITG